MKKWRNWLGGGSRITEEEYAANLTGMNTFFGAVLGFVLADIETVTSLDFAQLLLFTAALVIGILYISASRQRWLYAAFTAGLIFAIPHVTDQKGESLVRLQIALGTWLFMTIALELMKALSDRLKGSDAAKPPAP